MSDLNEWGRRSLIFGWSISSFKQISRTTGMNKTEEFFGIVQT